MKKLFDATYVNELPTDVIERLRDEMEAFNFDEEDIQNALDSKIEDIEDMLTAMDWTFYNLTEHGEDIEHLDDFDREVFNAIAGAELFHGDGSEELRIVENGEFYAVAFDGLSFSDLDDPWAVLACYMVEEGGLFDVPDYLSNYIDYSALGRDLSHDYYDYVETDDYFIFIHNV